MIDFDQPTSGMIDFDEAATKTPQKKPAYTAKDALAPWDAMLHLASGMASAPVAGIAGLGSLAVPGADSAGVVHKVQDALTYQPRTNLGGDMVDGISKILSLPAQAGDAAGGATTDATGSPAIGTLANVGVQSIPALLGSRGAGAVRANAASRFADNSVKNATMRRAVGAGYRIPPSEMVQSAPAKALMSVVESVAGKPAMQHDLSLANQRVVTAGARKDANIPGRGQIDESDVNAALKPRTAVYEEAANIGPDAAEIVTNWRKANDMAKKYDKEARANYTVAAEEKAAAYRKEANDWIQLLDQEAQRAGRTDLVPRIQQSRVELGKIGTVENALNDATGEVSAGSLRQARDRGVPLSGNMAAAAEMSEAFGNKLTQPNVLQAGVSQQNAAVAAMIAALKGVKGLALLGVPYLTRQALMSRPVQMATRPPERVVPMTAREEMLRAAVTSSLFGMPQGTVQDPKNAVDAFSDKRVRP